MFEFLNRAGEGLQRLHPIPSFTSLGSCPLVPQSLTVRMQSVPEAAPALPPLFTVGVGAALVFRLPSRTCVLSPKAVGSVRDGGQPRVRT